MNMRIQGLEMQSCRGTVGRRACVCVVAQWNAFGGSSRSRQYPPLTYSVNRQDLTGAELGMLLAVSHSEGMAGPDAIPLCRQNYSYWRSPEGLHHAAKLEIALRRSVATVACFTTWDVYGDAAASSSGGSGAAAAAQYVIVGDDVGDGKDWAAGQPQQPSSRSFTSASHLRDNHCHHQQQQSALQQPQQSWRPQEEECPLTAAQHERERELARRRSGRGSLAEVPRPSSWPSSLPSPSWLSHPVAEPSLLRDGHTSASAPRSGSASEALTSGPPASCRPCSYAPPPPSSSPPPSSLPSGLCGSKPPPPPGVPDMDWNWLLPSRGSSSSSGSSCSGGSSLSSGNSSTGKHGINGGQRSSTSLSSSSSAQQRPTYHHHDHRKQRAWQWPVPSSHAHTPRKSLVGFARATGDNSLVATIYDVAVHPAVRGQGIGHRLVKLLVQQVQARSVYDIGVVTPAAAAAFWERCSFDDDREGSTFMTFTGRPARLQRSDDCEKPPVAWEQGEQGHAVQVGTWWSCYGDAEASPSPQELMARAELLGCWDAAQRSEPLRALLETKLRAAAAAGGGRWAQAGEGSKVGWGAARLWGVAPSSLSE